METLAKIAGQEGREAYILANNPEVIYLVRLQDVPAFQEQFDGYDVCVADSGMMAEEVRGGEIHFGGLYWQVRNWR